MTCQNIIAVVKELRDKYKTGDPAELCRRMNILLLKQPMGTGDSSVKGFFVEKYRVRAITLNSELSPESARIITAHELGHAVLHGGSGLDLYSDADIFRQSSRLEREANLFAAELLLSDSEVLSTLNRDNSFFTAAAELFVPVELLDYKFHIMRTKGYHLVAPPITARNKFLKDMEVKGDDGEEGC